MNAQEITLIAVQQNPNGLAAYIYNDGDVVTERHGGFGLYDGSQTRAGIVRLPDLDLGDAPEPDCPVKILTWFPRGVAQ